MNLMNRGLLLTLALGLSMAVYAAPENGEQPRPEAEADHELHPTQEPGLDRDRALIRAQHLEERRLEEEEKRKGAGLDRERALKRAQKLEEQRKHEQQEH